VPPDGPDLHEDPTIRQAKLGGPEIDVHEKPPDQTDDEEEHASGSAVAAHETEECDEQEDNWPQEDNPMQPRSVDHRLAGN
jgi:hypothetical protein